MTDLLACGCPPMADADHAPDCDRNHWPHDACSDTVADPYDLAIAYAADRGTEDGKSAASWYFDGNTDRATYARVLQGIEDGDPEILDTLPAPDLSGEWADTLTGPALVESAVVNADDWTMTRAEWVAYWAERDPFADVCTAYEDAFTTAATDEIVRMARYQVEGTADMARKPTAPPRTDAHCWPFPCRDYHDTYAHKSGEDPCACACHGGRKRPGSAGPFGY